VAAVLIAGPVAANLESPVKIMVGVQIGRMIKYGPLEP
jgi:hypothetical protein